MAKTGKPSTAAKVAPVARPRGKTPAPSRRPRKVTSQQRVKLSGVLSDFEFTLINVMYGFSRWVETCMMAANVRGLGAVDILVLHAVNHRARDRRLHEICMVLNIDESHLVAYALKKLVTAGLVRFRTEGREHHYASTAQGDEACLAYRRMRDEFLVEGLSWMHDVGPELAHIERILRTMSGQYEQAGRLATAASISQPRKPPLRTKR